MSKPVLTADAAEVQRRILSANRLLRYDRETPAVVALLRSVAARLEVGIIGPGDAARLRQEAEMLARCLPPDVPVYPDDDPPD